jgi:septal ring factor EnvC (AmiA/AmiB activator)
MAGAVQTVPEVAADVLATAVEKAIKIERERSDRETELAVEKAKREAEVDHRIDGHEERLNVVNGSIAKTGAAMSALKASVDDFHDKQDKRNEKWDTEQAVHWRRSGQAFSKRQMLAAYLTIVAMVGAPAFSEIAKSLFG